MPTLRLQIAPYWNWNGGYDISGGSQWPPNRTILELKRTLILWRRFWISLQIAPYWNWNTSTLLESVQTLLDSKSHHTGIETDKMEEFVDSIDDSKSHHTGIETIECSMFRNMIISSKSHHTGIETMVGSRWFRYPGSSKSHHTGIETIDCRIPERDLTDSKSHHTGIETVLLNNHENSVHILQIAPYWNWNWHGHSQRMKFRVSPNRTILELKHAVTGTTVALEQAPNRTILELKQGYITVKLFGTPYSKSHHTGIETFCR